MRTVQRQSVHALHNPSTSAQVLLQSSKPNFAEFVSIGNVCFAEFRIRPQAQICTFGQANRNYEAIQTNWEHLEFQKCAPPSVVHDAILAYLSLRATRSLRNFRSVASCVLALPTVRVCRICERRRSCIAYHAVSDMCTTLRYSKVRGLKGAGGLYSSIHNLMSLSRGLSAGESSHTFQSSLLSCPKGMEPRRKILFAFRVTTMTALGLDPVSGSGP